MCRLLFFSLFLVVPLLALEPGTVIVTYQTNREGERLDRVRLWLQGEDGKVHIFPKKGAFAVDRNRAARTVVIGDLAPGHYKLEFVIPNRDGRYALPPAREIWIGNGEMVKIEQVIEEVAYLPEPPASVRKKGGLLIRYAFGEEESIAFQLKDEKGGVRKGPAGEDLCYPCDEESCYLLIEGVPAGLYELVFDGGDHTKPLSSQLVEVVAGETRFLFVEKSAKLTGES